MHVLEVTGAKKYLGPSVFALHLGRAIQLVVTSEL